MAEIEIERRPRRSGWKWLALVLVLAAVAVGAWLAFNNGGLPSDDTPPAAEEATGTIEPMTRPAPLDAAPETDSAGGPADPTSATPPR